MNVVPRLLLAELLKRFVSLLSISVIDIPRQSSLTGNHYKGTMLGKQSKAKQVIIPQNHRFRRRCGGVGSIFSLDINAQALLPCHPPSANDAGDEPIRFNLNNNLIESSFHYVDNRSNSVNNGLIS